MIDIDSKDKDKSIPNKDTTQIETISTKDSNQIEPASNASNINLTKNESLSSAKTNTDSTISMDIKETKNKIDNKKEDNSFNIFLSSVICITVIVIIIYIIFYMLKRRKKGNLVANEDLGQSSPEEKV